MTLAVLLRMVRFLFISAVTIQPGTAPRGHPIPGGQRRRPPGIGCPLGAVPAVKLMPESLLSTELSPAADRAEFLAWPHPL